MNVFDALRGMVIDLPTGRILPGWVDKASVIIAIDKLEGEYERAGDLDASCEVCRYGGHVIPPPHRVVDSATP